MYQHFCKYVKIIFFRYLILDQLNKIIDTVYGVDITYKFAFIFLFDSNNWMR